MRTLRSVPTFGRPTAHSSTLAASMLRLYDYFESGNAYKVRLLLAQLGIPFERVELDILKGETRTKAFLAKNPNHRIPLLEWPDGRTLAESNAILFHLAEGTPYLPQDPFERAQALQWMFFEQYSHEPYVAVVALYAYTHVADEGGFALGRFPAIRRWLERVRSQPGHVRITDPVGERVAWPVA